MNNNMNDMVYMQNSVSYDLIYFFNKGQYFKVKI